MAPPDSFRPADAALSTWRARVPALFAAALCTAACRGARSAPLAPPPQSATPAPSYPIDRVKPRTYRCARASGSIVIDGRLDEPSWRLAPLTAPFVDIEGEAKPRPRFQTRARMLWDERFLYVAAEMEEPELWATLTERDSVIYRDNDFEVFLDPDGDRHLYAELEINALGTEWDLLLVKPYRDGGPALHAWDVPGLQTAVALDGTLNDPSDVDRGWSVEIAFPWAALAEITEARLPPGEGDLWRVNMSRVEWRTHVVGGRHVKRTDPETKQPLAEDNWVWSPQGVIAMHRPETWGLVLFSEREAGTPLPAPTLPDDLGARRALLHVYEELRAGGVRDPAGRRPDWLEPGWSWPPELHRTPTLAEVLLRHVDGRALHLTGDGRLFTTREK